MNHITRLTCCAVALAAALPAAGQNLRQAQGSRIALPQDPDNPIARAVRHEIPVAVLYEDAQVIAFLADRPASKGHFIVASKTSAARNLLEMTPADLARIMGVVQRVAAADLKVAGADGFTVRQNNGSASSVPQFHVHVIPRWKGDSVKDGANPAVDVATLQPLAAQVRDQLRSGQ